MKMKKVLLFLIALLSLTSFTTNAQELRMPKYKFQDNWSISAGGGIMASFGDKTSIFEHKELINPSAYLGVNKYITPIIGARLQGEWKRFNTELDGVHTAGLYTDLLINPINIFTTNYERKFDVVIPVGIGYMHAFKYNDHKQDFLIPRIGLQLNYNISKAVQLNLECMAALANDKLDFIIDKAQYDGFITTSLGVTYKFKNHDGTRGFMYVPSYDQSDIDNLNNEINKLREECEKKPKIITKTSIVKETITVKEVAPVTVRFKINSAEIADDQMANLENIANYLKDNEDVSIYITGYADAETGSHDYNMELSKKRAEAVQKALANYGIKESRLSIGYEGDQVQQYAENDWNRAVIMTNIK